MASPSKKKAPGRQPEGFEKQTSKQRQSTCRAREIEAPRPARNRCGLTEAEKLDRALTRSLNILAQMPVDRARSLWMPGEDELQPACAPLAMLLDDSGGEAITSFDDATAVHYFLIWLRERRDRMRLAQRSAFEAVQARQRLRLVGRGRPE